MVYEGLGLRGFKFWVYGYGILGFRVDIVSIVVRFGFNLIFIL